MIRPYTTTTFSFPGVATTMPHPPDTATAFSWTGAAPLAMAIYREYAFAPA